MLTPASQTDSDNKLVAQTAPNGAMLLDPPLLEGHVLVVDDMPANLRLLTGILKVAGYKVSTASSGKGALDSITANAPDVVLLDIMMPDMDGFEVCQLIKSNPDTSFLPVVMVTALQETADRVNAIEAGADDFLTKPVDEVEVVARVKSLIRIKRQRDALENSYRELQRMEALRDNLVAMLVHDLRTPLTGILAPLAMLASDEFGHLDEEQQELVEICSQNGYSLLALINELLDINKLESGAMRLERRLTHFEQLVNEAMTQIMPLSVARTDEISIDIDPHLPILEIDADLIKRVIVNLVSNAVKFTPTGSLIKITARGANNLNGQAQASGDEIAAREPVVVVSVSDNGPGIPPEDQGKIFDKFGQVESRTMERKLSTGLGLTFCKLAVEAHNGRIWVDSMPDQGSTFSFALPLNTISGAGPSESQA